MTKQTPKLPPSSLEKSKFSYQSMVLAAEESFKKHGETASLSLYSTGFYDGVEWAYKMQQQQK